MDRPNLSAALTTVQITEILTKIGDIRTVLNFLINLTPEERQKYFKMGPKSVAYADLAEVTARNHPEILPSSFNTAEFTKDLQLTKAFVEINSLLLPLAEGVDDTLKLAGVEVMKQANQVYDFVKLAAKNNSALDSIRQELGRRYEQSSTPDATVPPVTPQDFVEFKIMRAVVFNHGDQFTATDGIAVRILKKNLFIKYAKTTFIRRADAGTNRRNQNKDFRYTKYTEFWREPDAQGKEK